VCEEVPEVGAAVGVPDMMPDVDAKVSPTGRELADHVVAVPVTMPERNGLRSRV